MGLAQRGDEIDGAESASEVEADDPFQVFGSSRGAVAVGDDLQVLGVHGHQFAVVGAYEAARIDGASSWQTLWKVTMPLSIPGIVSGITMVFMPSVTTFFIPRVLGGGNTMMFGDLIEAKFLTEGNWNVGSALSLIMMVLILISLSILRKADPNGEGGGIA